MMKKFLGGLLIACSLVGCAVDAGQAETKPAFDVASDDATIAASEGLSDSASRPTLMGEITPGPAVSEDFTRNKKYLAWYFDATAGQTIVLDVEGAGNNPELDTVAILYNATSTGRPSGASLAVNDDVSEGNVSSHISFKATETRRYVVVARRYDRGSRGTILVSLELRGRGTSCTQSSDCNAHQFCDTGATCGGSGTCTATEICPQMISPVCGCDGDTYTNECQANFAGTTVASDGDCGTSCPLTGVSCTPSCPGSGRIGGRPCRAGTFNSSTCTCEPLTDCRTTGCDSGESCSPCWGHFACIPRRAVC